MRTTQNPYQSLRVSLGPTLGCTAKKRYRLVGTALSAPRDGVAGSSKTRLVRVGCAERRPLSRRAGASWMNAVRHLGVGRAASALLHRLGRWAPGRVLRAAVLCAALGTLALCGSCKPPVAAVPPLDSGGPQRTSAPAPWVKVRPGHGVVLYEAPAQVLSAPETVAELTAPLRAQVVAISARPGQRVGAGTPLVTVIMPELLRAAFAYQGAGLRLTAYGQRREQLMQLKSDGLLRLAELAETEAHLAEAKAAQLEAQALLQLAGLPLSEAAALGSRDGRVSLRSPIAGVVTSVVAVLGHVSDGGPLVRIVGRGEPRIEARLPPSLPENIGFSLCLPHGACIPLHLIERAPLVDSRDGKTLAWLAPVGAAAAGAAPQAAGGAATTDFAALVAGLTATIQVSLLESAAAGDRAATAATRPVLVPARALLVHDSQPHVIRRQKGEPQHQAVRVLLATGADALVVAAGEPALQPGDEIAADAGPYAEVAEGGEP